MNYDHSKDDIYSANCDLFRIFVTVSVSMLALCRCDVVSGSGSGRQKKEKISVVLFVIAFIKSIVEFLDYSDNFLDCPEGGINPTPMS